MRNRIIILALCCFSLSLNAQKITGPSTNVSPLVQVERVVMPTLNNKELLDAELNQRAPGIAPRFAENLEVLINPDNQGTWEYTEGDLAVWRLHIISRGAKSLNLGFTKYIMPAGGELFLYAPDRSNVMGPFTPADNDDHEELWTPILEGDELVIEVKLPIDQIPNLSLELKHVNHDFIGFSDMSSLLSGNCNLDVICGEDDGWGIVDGYRDIIQSVAVISTGGSTFCTGFLINNAAQDCKPYFMTAYHCNISATNDQSLVAYWNYQNSFCREPGSAQSGAPGDGSLADFNTGSMFRARYQASDFVLVEFDDPVSETADAFFAGWSNEAIEPTSTIAVHHPSTDEKRISFEDAPGTFTTYLNDNPTTNFTHVRVADWDIGTTEPGSSGSPLFDQNKRIIGQLHGGYAACSNDDPDWYGSLHVSWEGGGTPNSRLKDWLDPDNLGLTELDGRAQNNCGFFVLANPVNYETCTDGEAYTIDLTISEDFNGPVTLSLNDIPGSLTGTFAANPVMPGEMTQLTIDDFAALPSGDYIMSIEATDGTDGTSQNIFLSAFADVPAIANAVFPIDGAQAIFTQINLLWEDLPFAGAYSYEVAKDPGFTDIIANGTGLSNTTITLPPLDPDTNYFWRVAANNICGDGVWSPVYTFKTANISCFQIWSPDSLPVEIPSSGTPTVTATITVPASFGGPILDVNIIDLEGTHTYISDLIFRLTSPEQTTVTLIDTYCDSEDDFFLSFDDQSPNMSIPCPYTDGATYTPFESLSAFNDEEASGVWTLTIEDTFNQDGGFLESWMLEICRALGPEIEPSTNMINTCQGEDTFFTIDVNTSFAGPVTLTLLNPPSGGSFTISPNPVMPGETATVDIMTTGIVNGSYPLDFEATDGTNAISTMVTLNIDDETPETASTPVPENGQLNFYPYGPSFSWSPVADAVSYEIRMDDNADMSSPFLFETVTDPSFNYPSSLDYGTWYYWTITTVGVCGSSESPVFEFRTSFYESTSEVDDNLYRLFPNPTNSELTLEFATPIQSDLVVEVFSIDGRQLQNHVLELGNRSLEIEFADYATGIYLIRLQSEGVSRVERILLAR